MKKSVLAFLGFAFIVYWFSTKDLPSDTKASLGPVAPSMVTMLPPVRHIASAGLPKPEAASRADSRFQLWMKHEASRVGKVDNHPEATFLRLKRHAQALDSHQLSLLTEISLNQALNGDERYLAVYLLGLSDAPRALDELKLVGLARIPKSDNDRQYSDEIVIRAHALESVVKRQPPTEAVKYLREILAKTPDASLAKHARDLMEHLN